MKQGKKWPTVNGRKITTFEHKWGISAKALAEHEGVTVDAIHMRTRNFGNPFQRRKTITYWEKKYGKTVVALAHELDIHPITVAGRERRYGDVYHESPAYIGIWNKSRFTAEVHWKDQSCWQVASMSTFFNLEDVV